MLNRLRRRLQRRRVFISYRRSDSGGYAGQIRERFERYYGSDATFFDHDSIEPGDKWAEVLERALDESDVLLAVIGPGWSDERATDGTRRLDDDDDWVRREIAAGLERDSIRVVPVLVGNASLPKEAELPSDLAGLRTRNSAEVRPDHFNADTKALVRSIGGWRAQLFGVPTYVWPLVGIAVLGIVALSIVAIRRDTNRPPMLPTELSVSTDQGVGIRIDLLENVDDDDVTTLSGFDPITPEKASITEVEPGVVLYRPEDDFHGFDSFGYSVSDADGAESAGNVSVEVAIGPMRGDFNVAVAQFEAVETQGSVSPDDAADISSEVYDRIHEELTILNEEGFDFQVRAPAYTGRVSGDTRAVRAAAAALLADEIDADVIVFGSVEADGIRPEFFVQNRESALSGAEELTGDHEMGSRILGSPLDLGSLTDNSTLRRSLAARARSLSRFVIGLSWYAGGEYGEALSAFGQADDPAWLETDGKEILYLFMGNAAGRQRDIETADDQYGRALDLNPEYARALLGAAEVEFFRAAIVGHEGDCLAGDVDSTQLERSEQLYTRASIAADRPAISNVDAKAAFGLGRLHTCATRAELGDRAAEARQELTSVIATYQDGAEGLRELAAEASANLGVLVISPPTDVDDPVELCEAVDHFEAALDLTEDERRERDLAQALLNVEDRLFKIDATCG